MKISDLSKNVQASWRGLIEDQVPQQFKTCLQYCYNQKVIDEKPIVYDIGANCGNFTKLVRKFMPGSEVIGFEAFDFHKQVHDFFEFRTYFVGLSNVNEKRRFYFGENEADIRSNVGNGNSYYKENKEISRSNTSYENSVEIQCYRLDDFKESNNLPDPDIVKIDVQGAEKDVILGGINTIKKAKILFLELPFVEYNIGAPKREEIIDILKFLGFSRNQEINKTPYDADYIFFRDDVELMN